jgi:hypothetical protein
MANKFAKLTTAALEKKIIEASQEDKALIQEVLDKRAAGSAAASDFSDEPAAAPVKSDKKAKVTKQKTAGKKKVTVKTKKVVAKPKVEHKKRVTNPLIGKIAEFVIHRTAIKIKGPIVKTITGDDGKPYIAIKDKEGHVRYKQRDVARIWK